MVLLSMDGNEGLFTSWDHKMPGAAAKVANIKSTPKSNC